MERGKEAALSLFLCDEIESFATGGELTHALPDE